MKRRDLRRRHRGEVELNITAFMNLMVVLVPFLLITAVFSRMAIIELNLPAASGVAAVVPANLDLEIIIRKEALEVGDRRGGLLKRFPAGKTGHDYAALTAFLLEIKSRFPAKTEASVLSEPGTTYAVLVKVMDSLREATVSRDGRAVTYELFTDIAVGDAPGAVE